MVKLTYRDKGELQAAIDEREEHFAMLARATDGRYLPCEFVWNLSNGRYTTSFALQSIVGTVSRSVPITIALQRKGAKTQSGAYNASMALKRFGYHSVTVTEKFEGEIIGRSQPIPPIKRTRPKRSKS